MILSPQAGLAVCSRCGCLRFSQILVSTVPFTPRRWQANSSAGIPQLQLREKFEVPKSYDLRHWFPMHMSVQLKKMEGKLRSVDLIVEVHDARIPITGRNRKFFSSLYAVRPHILVMNKMDLIDLRKYKRPIEEHYSKLGVKSVLWTNCKTRLSQAIKELQAEILGLLRSEPRYNRTVKTEYQIMVVGIPNVGKSSLINSMRKTNLGLKPTAVEEGARPGVTVRVQNRVRISDKPPIYVLDTPGVLAPHALQLEETMKLSLCNLILESATSPRYVADYLLYWLNKTGDFSYVDYLNLERPCDDIKAVLTNTCKANDFRRKCVIPGEGATERWDFDRAAAVLIEFYRKGLVSDRCLDKDLLLP